MLLFPNLTNKCMLACRNRSGWLETSIFVISAPNNPRFHS